MALDRRFVSVTGYALFAVALLAAPLVLGDFGLNRLARYLVFGMLAVAISVSWGYAGILNLGQGLFFGLGAYAIAMYLKLASPMSEQPGASGPVPDFMLWNAEPGAPVDLCCINATSPLWLPFQSEWFAIATGLLLPFALAAALAVLFYRKRISGAYISIILLALALLVRLLAIELQPLTNGYNGLTDLAILELHGVVFDAYSVEAYYLVAGALIVTLFATRLLLTTPAGVILRAISDNEDRARYLGFNVSLFMATFFGLSATIAGLAGMLYVVVTEFASPTFMNVSFSMSMVIWAAVGGRSSLLGACIGAIALNAIGTAASETPVLLEAWTALLGAIFVLVVLFLPRGLVGLAEDVIERLAAGLAAVRGGAAGREAATRAGRGTE